MKVADPAAAPSPRLHYLDGLRGWMALVVLLTHIFPAWLLDPRQLRAHGAGWLRFLFDWTPVGWATDGTQAVYVFFVISGIALSYPVLRASSPRQTLAVMAAYRYPRLAVPILASCFIAWVLLASGAFMNVAAAAHHPNGSWWARLYAFPPSFLDMVTFALWDTYGYTERSWNFVLWTMEVELKGSFMIFALLAFVPFRWLRLTIAAIASIYWIDPNNSHGYLVGFFVGYGLAELLYAAEGSAAIRARLVAATPLGWLCLAVAALLCTLRQTEQLGGARTGFMLQYNLTAALAVTGVVLVAPLRARLSNPLSHFLGRISFGLYLTHILVICSFSSALYVAMIDVVPYWLLVVVISSLTWALAIVVGYLFSLLIEEHLLLWIKRPIAAATRIALDWAESSPLGRRLRATP